MDDFAECLVVLAGIDSGSCEVAVEERLEEVIGLAAKLRERYASDSKG
ncbi:hypothetical protein ABZY36_13140 [Streptomyces sp. NPDC006627]